MRDKTMEKLKMVLTFIILIVTIGSFLCWIGKNADREKNERTEKVEKEYDYSKGIIEDIHSYKGHHIKIKYSINSVNHEYSGGWDNNPKKLNVGDSISFKYSVREPKLVITELEAKY